MANTITLTIPDLYTTFYRQIHAFEAGTIDKIIIEDNTEWRDNAGKTGLLPADNNYVGVMVPASEYLPLLSYMEIHMPQHVVYKEIANSSDQYDKNGLYKLTSNIRNLSTVDFATVAASYTYDSAAANADITVTARVPGDVGNKVLATVVNGVNPPSVTDGASSFTLGVTNGLTTAASAVNAFAGTDAVYLVTPEVEGDGSGVLTIAETVSGQFSIGLHAGATTGYTVGGFYASANCPAVTAPNGIVLTSMLAGFESNAYTVNVVNQSGTNPLAISWASPVLTIMPETNADVIIGAVSSVVAFGGWGDLEAMPFTCAATGSDDTSVMAESSVKFGGGKLRSYKKFAWKSLFLHRTKNADPAYVIVGYKQALKLNLI